MNCTRKFDVDYYSWETGAKQFSHKYTEEWEKLELFCPKCGKNEVWREAGPGDVDVGEMYMCISCGATFNLPGGIACTGNEQDAQRLAKLKGGA